MPAGMHTRFVRVVTRYGGKQHIAVDQGMLGAGRHYAVCTGTSAWTITSWEAEPDHPHLTIEEIRALPACEACARFVNPPLDGPRAVS